MEVFWSSHQPGSLVKVINTISGILSIPPQPLSYSPEVNRVHAGSHNRNTTAFEAESDLIYRKVMKLESNPYFKLYIDP